MIRSVICISISRPPPSIKSMDGAGHVVYMKSFSKVLAPGCRIACVAAEGNILSRLIAAKSSSDLGSPLLTQRAVLPFIDRRYEAYAAKLRTALRLRKEAAVMLLKQYAPAGVSWTLPEGGLNLWLQLPQSGIDKLHALADQDGISFLPGDVCYAGDTPSRHIRLCYSQLTQKDMERGLSSSCICWTGICVQSANKPSRVRPGGQAPNSLHGFQLFTDMLGE
jgi:DNA-binding transcriptional MocR family regulator